MSDLEFQLEHSGYSRAGFARRYDAYRPRPPELLLDLLPRLAGVERPRLVVDLGSGTGLSTRFWATSAEEVVGIEPNAEMRVYAREATDAANVTYPDGVSSYGTGVTDGAADLVTASQSLQWMEPAPTFAEIGRILRPGGVFAAYQYDGLQTPFWEPEAAFAAVIRRMRELRSEREFDTGKERWPVSRERLAESSVFREARELLVHSVEEGDAERLVGFALSMGSLATLLEQGATEEEVGLDRLRDVAARTLAKPAPWWLSYRVWVGRK